MKQNKDFFWPSYVDLMTALFLVMLVLFVLSYKMFHDKEKANIDLIAELKVKADEKEKLDEIKNSLERLKGNFFRFNEECKRHELKINVVFPSAVKFPLQAADIPDDKKDSLYLAGKFLRDSISAIRTELNVKYLIVVEGRAAKNADKADSDPVNRDGPKVRDLSFRRAMALVNFWKNRGLNFDQGLFEIVAAGSGFEGACRYPSSEETKNRRFVIQILPKVGAFTNPQTPSAIASPPPGD